MGNKIVTKQDTLIEWMCRYLFKNFGNAGDGCLLVFIQYFGVNLGGGEVAMA